MNVQPLEPITSVKVLKNVPLDNSYKDTRSFSSSSQQISYFSSLKKYEFNNLTPIKLQNKIRLPINASALYDCNYIMFQNANFNQKWFYAFISSINYVGVNNCEITFEIDVLQTWYFDYKLNPCMVLREHSNTDAVGDNLVTENIDYGYYVSETAETPDYFLSYSAVLATAWEQDGKCGGYRGGLFSGINYIPYLVNNTEQVNALIEFLDSAVSANQIDSIISIFMMPTEFIAPSTSPVTKRFDAALQTDKIGSYIPKNKKLLSYPFNMLEVYTVDGASAIYKYELFQSRESCGFFLTCGMSCNPEIVLQPIAYNKQQINNEETLTLGSFPQCAYAVDSFKAFLAQNGASTLISMATTGLAMASGNPTALAMGAMGLASSVNSVVQNSMKPPSIRGTQSTSTFTASREKNFYFANKHITEEYAKNIDSFFDVYGYQTNRVKIPNITGRPFWNYVQTENCNITGSIPFNDISKIKSIFNDGITFWHTNDIGNYSLNNTI